jgi:hypothetical protein
MPSAGTGHFTQLAGIRPFPILQNLVIALPYLDGASGGWPMGIGILYYFPRPLNFVGSLILKP